MDLATLNGAVNQLPAPPSPTDSIKTLFEEVEQAKVLFHVKIVCHAPNPLSSNAMKMHFLDIFFDTNH